MGVWRDPSHMGKLTSLQLEFPAQGELVDSSSSHPGGLLSACIDGPLLREPVDILRVG